MLGITLPVFSASSSGLTISSSVGTPISSSSSIPTFIDTFHTPSQASLARNTFPGCPSLPQKVIQKIMAFEYVDFADLLPDQLRTSGAGEINNKFVILPESTYETQRKKKRQIPDIATWIQVYSIYFLAMASHFKEMVPELIAYQLCIVQHSKRFEYPSWLHYDVEFRQWAAATKFMQWSQIHPQFYAFAFTSQGRASSWCPICQVDGGNHTYDCPKYSAFCPTVKLANLNQSFPNRASSNAKPLIPPQAKRAAKMDHCILFNKYRGNCPYGSECKFDHKCAHCALSHPVTSCPTKSKSTH